MALVPKWRPMTWVIVIINILFLVWVISAGGAAAENCDDVARAERDACEAGTAIGASIGIGLVLFLWALVDIILGVIWLVTNRKKTRECPICGYDVKKGVTSCKKCGYDFATGERAPAQAQG